jgi:hypothetical protein
VTRRKKRRRRRKWRSRRKKEKKKKPKLNKQNFLKLIDGQNLKNVLEMESPDYHHISQYNYLTMRLRR